MSGGFQALTGSDHAALVPAWQGSSALLHADVLQHWQSLQVAGQQAGFDVRIASAFRSFDRQRDIWNAKATGQRAVLDDDGNALDIATLSEDALLFAILRWSAIPGCSRHHWGTDMDIYDASAVPVGYAVQLTAAECAEGGPFAPVHQWLDGYLPSSPFFRPYAEDRGGIAPERWHLSCRPVAAGFEALLSEKRLGDWIATQDIALKTVILKHWHDIFQRYVLVNPAV